MFSRAHCVCVCVCLKHNQMPLSLSLSLFLFPFLVAEHSLNRHTHKTSRESMGPILPPSHPLDVRVLPLEFVQLKLRLCASASVVVAVAVAAVAHRLSLLAQHPVHSRRPHHARLHASTNSFSPSLSYSLKRRPERELNSLADATTQTLEWKLRGAPISIQTLKASNRASIHTQAVFSLVCASSSNFEFESKRKRKLTTAPFR